MRRLSKSGASLWVLAGITMALGACAKAPEGKSSPQALVPQTKANADLTWIQDLDIPKPAVDLGYVPGSTGHPMAFRRAMEAYEKGEYEDSLARLSAINQLAPEAADPWFFRGASLLLAGRRSEAIMPLQVAAEKGSEERSTSSHYYLGLTRLKLGDLGSAQDNLRKAAGGAGSHASRAAELLTKL